LGKVATEVLGGSQTYSASVQSEKIRNLRSLTLYWYVCSLQVFTTPSLFAPAASALTQSRAEEAPGALNGHKGSSAVAATWNLGLANPRLSEMFLAHVCRRKEISIKILRGNGWTYSPNTGIVICSELEVMIGLVTN